MHRSSWASIWIVTSVIAVAIAIGTVLSGFTPTLEDGFYGTDTYLRMMRVRDLLNDFSWFEVQQVNANAPFGLELHWTRPWDLILYLFALPLSLFLAQDLALVVTGAIVPPIFLVATSLVTAWAAGIAFGREARLWAALAIFVQPATVSYALAGRPDHHVFQFLIFAGVIGLILNIIREHAPLKSSAGLGALAVLGLWVSPEFLVLLFVAAVTMGLLAVSRGDEFLPRFRIFGLSALLGIVIGLLLERGAPTNWTNELDRLSWVHFWAISAVFVVAWLYSLVSQMIAVRTVHGRFILLGAIAAATAAGLLLYTPELIVDPMRAATSEGPAWITEIAELRPLLPTNFLTLGRFTMELGMPLLGIGFAAYQLRLSSPGETRQQWLFLAVCVILFFGLGLYQYRSAPYAEIVGAIILAAVVCQLRAKVEAASRGSEASVRLAIVTAVPLIGFALVGSAIMDAAAEPSEAGPAPSCKVAAIVPILSGIAAERADPPVVLTSMNFTPELLYRSSVHVIGLPSHRNSPAVQDGYRALDGPDEALAVGIIRDRNVSHILLCPGITERSPYSDAERAAGLGARLIEGEGPEWIAEIPIGDPATSFRLFEVLGSASP